MFTSSLIYSVSLHVLSVWKTFYFWNYLKAKYVHFKLVFSSVHCLSLHLSNETTFYFRYKHDSYQLLLHQPSRFIKKTGLGLGSLHYDYKVCHKHHNIRIWNLPIFPCVCTKKSKIRNKYEGNKYSHWIDVNKQNVEFCRKWSCIDQLLTAWN